MSNVLRLAIVDPSDNSRTQLKNQLLGMDIVWLEAMWHLLRDEALTCS